HLSGVALPEARKARYKELKSELSKLTTKFSNNLLDATNAWHKLIAEEAGVAGLPESSKGMLRQAAEREGQQGWRISLEFPSYFAVMTYADDRALREEV
ncbi:MAG: oligopeptidase A, partial [Anaerolineae bacterium]|nr:oligopeptidase A [Anaerolineae bacterium]